MTPSMCTAAHLPTITTHGAADQAERLSLAVDGGGSKTLALIVDARGVERGRGEAGSANPRAVGDARALAAVWTAAQAAARAAGEVLPLAGAWCGLAGIVTSDDAERLRPHLEGLAAALHLTSDAELPLGALPGHIGVALIAGTGCVALGRDAAGRRARAGGWGHLLGDEGSAYDIARQALSAATRAADGRGPATRLLPRILAEWRLGEPAALIGYVHQAPEKASVAALAPLVLRAAAEGDGVARAIVRSATAEVALAAVAVSDALGFSGGLLPLALAGSLLVRDGTFRARVVRRVARHGTLGHVALVAEPALVAARALASARAVAQGA